MNTNDLKITSEAVIHSEAIYVGIMVSFTGDATFLRPIVLGRKENVDKHVDVVGPLDLIMKMTVEELKSGTDPSKH